MEKRWREDLEQQRFGGFFEPTHCWGVWTGHLVLKLSTAMWIAHKFPPCFSTWTSKTELHLENGSKGQLLLFLHTDIKHRTYSCTEKKEVATRHRKKSIENFGKANNGDRTASFFPSKAVSYHSTVTTFLFKGYKIANTCVWPWATQV